MWIERHETRNGGWEVARREPRAQLSPYLLGAPEGWAQLRGESSAMREVPFPGVPLIFNLGTPWEIEDPKAPPERRDSFVAGMHAAPTIVRAAPPGHALSFASRRSAPAAFWACRCTSSPTGPPTSPT